MAVIINKLAEVHTNKIGDDTLIWQFAIILEGAIIGKNCNINCHTFIENDVIIGDNVTIKSGVYLWDGIEIKDNVFVGPNVTFTNNKYPKSKIYPSKLKKTTIENNASIGAGAIILGGLNIGAFSLIGAGSVVTKDVKPYSLVVGNPAKFIAYIDEDANKLAWNGTEYESINGKKYFFEKI